MYTNYDTIIIGAGIGGLTCGTGLISQGQRVLICESNPRPGGYIAGLYQGGFAFDCAHFLLGSRDEIIGGPLIPVDPITRIRLPDVELTYESWNLIFELEKQFPHEVPAIHSFFQLLDRLNDEWAKRPPQQPFYLMNPLERGARTWKEKLSQPLTHQYRGKTLEEVLGTWFEDERLAVVLATLLPWKDGLFLNLGGKWNDIIHRRLSYPQGGYQALTNRMAAEFTSLGGDLAYETEVVDVVVQEGKATGIRLGEGERIWAPRIIVGSDPVGTLETILEPSLLPDTYLEQWRGVEPEPLGVYVYLGVALAGENIPFHRAVVCGSNSLSQYTGRFNGLEDSPLFIDVPDKYETGMAPDGKTLVVLHLPAYQDDVDNLRLSLDEIREGLIDRAAALIPKLKERIVFKQVVDPQTFSQYSIKSRGIRRGWGDGFSTVPGHRTPIKGLYLTGQWTEPGGGIGGAAQSGKTLADLLLKKRI